MELSSRFATATHRSPGSFRGEARHRALGQRECRAYVSEQPGFLRAARFVALDGALLVVTETTWCTVEHRRTGGVNHAHARDLVQGHGARHRGKDRLTVGRSI